MQDKQNWQCPYCGHSQVLLEEQNLKINKSTEIVRISEHDFIGFQVISVACLNQECQKLSLVFFLNKCSRYSTEVLFNKIIQKWRLLPDSIAKPQPDYIPKAIRKDYEEACKIAHLSPNASAVLARRCLQGTIRDFCKIKGKTLHEEVKKLENAVQKHSISGVTEESIKAIDSIRKMGNIGAHMEQPTGMLIDIEPNEATLLIQLIETLFKDWYVARYERQQNLKNIQEITTTKVQQKNNRADKIRPIKEKELVEERK